jgi:hypothetical protein
MQEVQWVSGRQDKRWMGRGMRHSGSRSLNFELELEAPRGNLGSVAHEVDWKVKGERGCETRGV